MENKTTNYQIRFYDKRGVIFYEGEFGDCMYEIQQGSVGVYVNYEKDNERKLTTLGPGDYFGEMAIIEACPRTATIVALENSTILKMVNSRDFPTYAAENPDKVLKIMYSMGVRAQNLQKKYEGSCTLIREFLDCHAKLKEYSVELMERASEYLKSSKAGRA